MWAVSHCFWTTCRRATTVPLRRCYHKSSIVTSNYSKKWCRRWGLSPRLSCNRINSIPVHAFIQHARENLGRVDSQNRIYCSFNRLLTGPTDLLLLVEAVNRPVGASLIITETFSSSVLVVHDLHEPNQKQNRQTNTNQISETFQEPHNQILLKQSRGQQKPNRPLLGVFFRK